MPTIVDYVLRERDTFAERPLCRVDSLCLSWLSYLRFPVESTSRSAEGVSLADLDRDEWRLKMVAALHDSDTSEALLRAMAASPRFSGVRVALHVDERNDEEGKQFSATTFLLPGGGAYVAFRGTDDSIVGWKENFGLACSAGIPAQVSALAYLQLAALSEDGPLWVGGHSKGGNLAVYAARKAPDQVRSRVRACFTHDGPGFCPEAVAAGGWHDDVTVDKTIPTESLVGMLFEKNQQGFAVVKSSEQSIMQHSPLSWQVEGRDFACVAGMDYSAWKLVRRLNDWLAEHDTASRLAFANTLAWLADVTAETSFSSLIQRWQGNSEAMRAALDAAPAEEREAFEAAMEDLVTTLLLGSATEYDRSPKTPTQAAASAERQVDDLTAKFNSKLADLERRTGGL